MAISTYAELQTAITNWLHRSDLATVVPDFITIGETWIKRYARLREMESALSVTIASGVAAVPSDFMALKNARVSGQNVRVEIRPADWIYDNYATRSGSGIPKFIGVEGSNFVFGPYPGGYTILGTYYADPGVVSASAHSLFTRNPDLYLYASLAAAEPYLKNDARLPIWVAQREQIMKDANRYAEDSRFGDGLAVRAA